MTVDQIAILLIIVMTFLLFIWGRWRYDIVSVIALGTLFIADQVLGGQTSNLIIEGSNVFIGFAHPAVITVALVLIISRALRNAGVVELISRQIAPFSKYQVTHITSLSGVVSTCTIVFSGTLWPEHRKAAIPLGQLPQNFCTGTYLDFKAIAGK